MANIEFNKSLLYQGYLNFLLIIRKKSFNNYHKQSKNLIQ